MREQLAAVVDAYSDELAALNRQIATLAESKMNVTAAALSKQPTTLNMPPGTSAAASAAPRPKAASGAGADASPSAAEAHNLVAAASGRADAWKSAYEVGTAPHHITSHRLWWQYTNLHVPSVQP